MNGKRYNRFKKRKFVSPTRWAINHVILNLLKNLEKQEPKKRIYINLFNSGIVIDSKEVRSKILKHAKTYFNLQ